MGFSKTFNKVEIHLYNVNAPFVYNLFLHSLKVNKSFGKKLEGIDSLFESFLIWSLWKGFTNSTKFFFYKNYKFTNYKLLNQLV